VHPNFKEKGESSQISLNFICHAWLNDGKFVVCTDIG